MIPYDNSCRDVTIHSVEEASTNSLINDGTGTHMNETRNLAAEETTLSACARHKAVPTDNKK